MKSNREFRKIATDKMDFSVSVAVRKAYVSYYFAINQTTVGTYFSNRFKNS